MEIMESTLQMMEEGDKHIQLSRNRDLIALLGLTGSGKTTIALFLTSDNKELTAVEVGIGDYLITDKNKKISSPTNTLNSQTIFPEMMIDPTTGTVFYDSPGFKDTRNSSMEIATTFFMKKILNHAERIKLIFVVDHKIVLPTASRTEFPDLLRHATNLIKNVEKFKDGIGVIFTKVQNKYRKLNDALTLVDDNQTIENVAQFLRSIVSTNDGRLDEEMIKFVNIILAKQGENYTRMSLFRNPDRAGPLSDIPTVQAAKENIIQMVHRNLQYVPSNETDFGYTITDVAEMNIIDMLQNITQDLTQKLTNAMEKVKQHFSEQENQRDNIETLQLKYRNASNQLTKIVQETSTEFVELFESVHKFIKDFKMTNLEYDSLDVKRLGEKLRLVSVVAPKRNINHSFETIVSPVKTIDRLFDELKNWFTFLTTFEDYTAKFERLRKAPRKYNEVKEQLAAVERNEKEMTGRDLAEFLNEISGGNKFIFGFDLMKNVVINPVRARMLNEIMESTLITRPKAWCYDSDKLRITALYLKLSEALAAPGCSAGTRFMEIFVAKKLLIDTDFIKIGQNLNLIIVSPTWEVLGNRRIQLDGYTASVYSPSTAPDGSPGQGIGGNGGNGANGNPGLPGGNGGNFFGIAHEIVNPEKLTVTVNGGAGGLGQHAGNGGNGAKGQDASRVTEHSHGHRVHRGDADYIRHDTFKKDGEAGGRGGQGGRGGAGGLGGRRGSVRLLVSTSKSNVKISSQDGAIGAHGNRGMGGFNGLWGKDCYGVRKREWTLGFRETSWRGEGCKDDNRKTVQRNEIDNTALNFEGIQHPPVQSNPNFGYVLNDYKKYIAQTAPLTPYVKIPTTLTDLSNDYTTRNRRETGAIFSHGIQDALYSSFHLLDLIVRKCTNVKPLHNHNDTNNDMKLIDLMNLTQRFEELLIDLEANHGLINKRCTGFNPMSMIDELRGLSPEEIHQNLLKRVQSYGLKFDSSEIDRLVNKTRT